MHQQIELNMQTYEHSTGNFTTFGNLTDTNNQSKGASGLASRVRGVFAGGNSELIRH